ncbi:hypothetical protein JYU34_005377 [Plutella xylostella]|uniref:Uncharacterized protein n=1 Tax=Plutella xylostella TaxID=51655 RepID=A0ABQ7QWI3_PLUXY|nr:hypothetical protein JYU34_005377 [Plutella xylostella]
MEVGNGRGTHGNDSDATWRIRSLEMEGEAPPKFQRRLDQATDLADAILPSNRGRGMQRESDDDAFGDEQAPGKRVGNFGTRRGKSNDHWTNTRVVLLLC